MRVTGVGSLPHIDAAEAAAFVAETTNLPYLPQLANRHPSEGMLRQWGEGLCGAVGTDDGIGLRYGEPIHASDEAFVGAAAMLTSANGPVIKTQFTGPLTLFLALLAAGCRYEGLWDCVVDGLVERVNAHIAWIRSTRPDLDVIAMMDEPALVTFAPERADGPVAIEVAAGALSRVMGEIANPVGIHVCGDTDWRTVAGLRPSWLSWDLAGLGDGFLNATDAIAEAIAHGTGVMWGLVPTDPAPIDTDRIRSRYGTAVTRLVIDGAPVERLTHTSVATPACGLAGLSIGGAEVVMDRVHAAVALLDD